MSYFHELFCSYGLQGFPAIDRSLVLSAQGGVGRCVAWQISFKAVGLTFDLSLVTELLPLAITMSYYHELLP